MREPPRIDPKAVEEVRLALIACREWLSKKANARVIAFAIPENETEKLVHRCAGALGNMWSIFMPDEENQPSGGATPADAPTPPAAEAFSGAPTLEQRIEAWLEDPSGTYAVKLLREARAALLALRQSRDEDVHPELRQHLEQIANRESVPDDARWIRGASSALQIIERRALRAEAEVARLRTALEWQKSKL